MQLGEEARWAVGLALEEVAVVEGCFVSAVAYLNEGAQAKSLEHGFLLADCHLHRSQSALHIAALADR